MLSWNEIRHRAIAFSRDWKDTTSEKSERQSFWNEFFEIFGIRRRTVATFEEPVRKLSGNWGYIDLFWPARVLIEHKSAGQCLDKAHAQGMDYLRGLTDSGRQAEAPRWLIVSDFQRLALHDLEAEPGSPAASIEFPLKDLHKHIRRFVFILGRERQQIDPEDPANIKAAELMAGLHDALEAGGFSGHDLRVLLVRLLFCLFADDTGIFNQQDFKTFLTHRTAADGSDTGPKLARLFEVLNIPPENRQANLDEDLAAFPYVNGALFAERISFADFNTSMRAALLKACAFRWERISPAVFGSLFQGVMEKAERREKGAHYTAEKNILKLIRPLFLDSLRAEFDAARADKSTRRTARLEALQQQLSGLTFLDPACGCGNFLVITYRELRALELEILLELHRNDLQQTQHEFAFDVNSLSLIDVDQMFGIELEEFPARIAEVALWLADHQANIALSEAFGQLYQRIPLRKSPHIHHANALRTDWKTVLPPEKCSYILGNPPFVGKHYQTAGQKADMAAVFGDFGNIGDVDFVVSWFVKAAEYMTGTSIRCGLVATNSIVQGEQVPIVWGLLFGRYRVKIHFAHRTFAWESEARGKAHVHVVIIGFGLTDCVPKRIYEYDSNPEHPVIVETNNISPYLTSGSGGFVTKRTKPIGNVPEMRCGNKPSDGGNFILTDIQKQELVAIEPGAAKFLKRFTGSEEFINGNMRWCLWLTDVDPAELRAMPEVMKRVSAVKDFRERSTAAPTRKAAQSPTLFFYISQPKTDFIAIPEVSSERRSYIPIGFISPDVIVSNKIFIIPEPSLYLFGLLSSAIHMAWMRLVGGRLKSDYSYSGSMVYNNFPWPMAATEVQRQKVEESAQAVLAARAEFPGSTLADLYDPVAMPPALAKAHAALDRAVDRCYRKDPFHTDRQRVEFLFALYEQLAAPLVKPVKRPRKTGTPKAGGTESGATA